MISGKYIKQQTQSGNTFHRPKIRLSIILQNTMAAFSVKDIVYNDWGLFKEMTWIYIFARVQQQQSNSNKEYTNLLLYNIHTP